MIYERKKQKMVRLNGKPIENFAEFEFDAQSETKEVNPKLFYASEEFEEQYEKLEDMPKYVPIKKNRWS